MATACSTGAPPPRSPEVTLVVTNARVWTGDTAHPWAEALAAAGDTLVAVGPRTAVETLPRATDARVLDVAGGTVVPGFIDAHVHFLDGGRRLSSVQLRDVATREEFVRRLEAFARTVPAGAWITGGDWDHSLWGGTLPERGWIDAVTKDHPVWVNRLDGHMALANSLALQKAGITAATKDVDGGEIVRDRAGRPTGLLKDNAMALVDAAVSAPSAAEMDRALDAAMKYVAERGVTSVHHMGSWDDLGVFLRAWREKRLTTRIYAAVPLDTWERLRDRIASRELGPDGRGDAWLRIGLLKGFVDGSLGSHTAAFEAPYDDAPHDNGLLVNDPGALSAWIDGADGAGLQVAVHAIGDRANGLLLDIFDRVEKKRGRRDRRFRIEHAQHLRANDFPRFRQLGVVASMQPYHAIDDGRWAERSIGRRIETTYAFRSLIDAGATLAFGSDWFVAPPTPLDGLYAATTRRTLDDRNPDGWVPGQKIGLEAALRAYTKGAAYAGFSEKQVGTLAAGMLADCVVIDRNPFESPSERVRDLKIVATVVGGRVVYSR